MTISSDSKRKSRTLIWCAEIGLLLGALTVGFISLVERQLPYSEWKVAITDAAMLPAMIIARAFYPEGVHTDTGASAWVVAFIGSGVLFYSFVWFFVLAMIIQRRRAHS